MNLSTAKRGLRWDVLVIVLGLVAAACGAAGSNVAAPRPDASISQLAAEFAPCSGFDNVASAPEYVSSAVGWLRVEQVVAADRDAGDRKPAFPAKVMAGDFITSDITEAEVDINSGHWPGIDWALANSGEVWLALGKDKLYETTGNPVLYTIVFTATGRAFFAGHCQHDILYAPLQGKFGDSFEDTMRDMVGMTGDELTALVNPAR